ncbi:hypothetical protein VTI74DRAFT_2513 [Chaetomium olivicolor]
MGYAEHSSTLPLLAIDSSEPVDFDYGAFLPDQQDIAYLGDESSGSSTSPPHSTTSPGSATLSDAPLQTLAPRQQHLSPSVAFAIQPRGSATGRASPRSPGAPPQQKHRLERRGHTKSRRGCFNCKRRRIKCQETRPACGHCLKQGLKCEYPALPSVVHQPQHQVPIFSLQDMRFFQHFLLNCYPHHPIGSEHLWTHEIPCLSEKYEYLMHAILGYAASDLLSTSDPGLLEAAMTHRLKAIKAIKKSLSAAASSSSSSSSSSCCSSSTAQSSCGSGTDMFEEGNALMATCFALTYQSVHLDDGMAEYMTFIRGIMIVAIQMYIKGAKLLFGQMLGDKQKEMLEPFMRDVPLVEKSWVDAAVEAIQGLEGLVQGEGREVERKYWELLLEMGKACWESSWKGYLALSEHYTWWMMLPHDKFQRLVDPDNQVAILLGSHWVALEQIMATITDAEYKAAAKMPAKKPEGTVSLGTIRWLKWLNAQLDSEHVVYNQFPLWVEAQLDKDRSFFGRSC